jgi:preprotein translocase subunit SecG
MFLQVALILLHIVVCLVLILVVLLQTGKRADLAGAFGGGGSQTVFGARGAATALSKITTAAAVLFMLTSLGLSLLSSRSAGTASSALDELPAAGQTAPAPEGQPGDAALPPVDAPEQPADEPIDDLGESPVEEPGQ